MPTLMDELKSAVAAAVREEDRCRTASYKLWPGVEGGKKRQQDATFVRQVLNSGFGDALLQIADDNLVAAVARVKSITDAIRSLADDKEAELQKRTNEGRAP